MMTWQSRFASETLTDTPIVRCRLLAGSRILAVLEGAPRILRCVDNSVKWFTPWDESERFVSRPCELSMSWQRASGVLPRVLP